MTAPLIAIVGSYNPERANELSLRNIEQSQTAGVELGRELARQGCHIVVYASYPYLLEVDVVAGYVEVKKTNPEPNCIQVHFSVKYDQPTFTDEADNRGLFDFKPDTSPAWEVSFYRSLRQIDGALVLGGGPSSMIAGVVSMGYGKPICAIASFGGYAKKIWELLPVQQKLLTAEEIFVMAEQWRPELAERYVQILLRQLDQLASAEQEEAEERARAQESVRQQLAEKDEKLRVELERQSEALNKSFAEQMAAERKAWTDSRRAVKLYAIVSAVFLTVALGLWGFALGRPGIGPAWLIAFLIAVPLVGGISGSTIRVAFGALGIGDTKPLGSGQIPPVVTNASMGLVGGGITMLIYITTQFIAIGDEILPKHYLRLIPFALATAFVAGFALDIVVRKLLETAEKGMPPAFPPKD